MPGDLILGDEYSILLGYPGHGSDFDMKVTLTMAGT